MDRSDLLEFSVDKKPDGTIERGGGGDDGATGSRRVGSGEERETGRERPPWVKYLLEEGIDHTQAFLRYKGMFAGAVNVPKSAEGLFSRCCDFAHLQRLRLTIGSRVRASAVEEIFVI